MGENDSQEGSPYKPDKGALAGIAVTLGLKALWRGIQAWRKRRARKRANRDRANG